MKRLHVHVAVENLDASVRFYSQLFAAEPTVRKDDYAKWMLEDPRVNFAVSTGGMAPGVHHLGVQVENRVELADVYSRLQRADGPVLEQGAISCCYAKSEKAGSSDPQGVKWETFLTTGESTTYGCDIARLATEHLLPAEGGLDRGASGGSADVQRPLPVHRELGAQHPGGVAAESLGRGKFRAYSAGSFPKGECNPLALELLRRLDLPTEGLRSKSWDEFAQPGAPELDFVITVCDNAAGEVCPIWPGHPVTAHWGLPDPAAAEGTQAERLLAFRETVRALENRIKPFVELPIASLDHLKVQEHVREIGRMPRADGK